MTELNSRKTQFISSITRDSDWTTVFPEWLISWHSSVMYFTCTIWLVFSWLLKPLLPIVFDDYPLFRYLNNVGEGRKYSAHSCRQKRRRTAKPNVSMFHNLDCEDDVKIPRWVHKTLLLSVGLQNYWQILCVTIKRPMNVIPRGAGAVANIFLNNHFNISNVYNFIIKQTLMLFWVFDTCVLRSLE